MIGDYARLRAVGRLCQETGLTHTEIGAMDAERVAKLMAVNEGFCAWRHDEEMR